MVFVTISAYPSGWITLLRESSPTWSRHFPFLWNVKIRRRFHTREILVPVLSQLWLNPGYSLLPCMFPGQPLITFLPSRQIIRNCPHICAFIRVESYFHFHPEKMYCNQPFLFTILATCFGFNKPILRLTTTNTYKYEGTLYITYQTNCI